MYSGAASGRIQCKTPNIQNISRDYQESEWLWQQCREKERDTGHKLCDDCHDRFRCWTASRPQTLVFGDTHIGLQRISEAFSRLSYQLCEAMTRKFDNEVLKF